MKKWNKKEIDSDAVRELCKRYSIDALSASILYRRGITSSEEIQWFLEDDARFMHSPFEFAQMEDAVDRILAARDEGEKVLIFGDRDVDGMTATTILYKQLSRMGIDVRYRLPKGDEPYGLSMAAVEEFAAEDGTLLITVDCGISNFAEIEKANEFGISVIVTDHHSPQEELPNADVILNPKCRDAGYPFDGISGCAVAFKLAQALRFAQSDFYNQQICLMNVSGAGEEVGNSGAVEIECLKVRNMTQTKRFSLKIDASMSHDKLYSLLDFLRGEQIFVWDAQKILAALKGVFGTGIDFNLFDLRPECAKIIPSVAALSLEKILASSKIARYKKEQTQIDAFFNIFVTWAEKKLSAENAKCDEEDLQFAMLAVMSDIMPLKNENRIIVKRALSLINNGQTVSGLREIISRQELSGKRINAKDISWSVVPVLNSAGRLGEPELTLRLFLETDTKETNDLARKILDMNEERKNLVANAMDFLGSRPEEAAKKFGGKFCYVREPKMHRGVIGLIAARLLQRIGAPVIAVTEIENNGEKLCIGSMRSNDGLNCADFLGNFDDLTLSHGGHAAAGGFSIAAKNIEAFEKRLAEVIGTLAPSSSSNSSFAEEEENEIDAELFPQYLTNELIETIDKFEPYGNECPEILFLTRGAKIVDARIIGKGERLHLKFTLEIGTLKWPALWWGEADRLGGEFNVGDEIDLVYNYSRNTFNGHEGRQLVVVDAKKRN